jgi:uncharacterized protein YgiM (DUF1202 family)
VDTWNGIRSQVDPNHNDIWISEGVDTSFLSVFDGHHLYSNTWNPPADLNSVDQKFAGQVAAAANAYGASKIWVATVMPGYNDIKVRGGFAQDRQGGNYFAQSWSAAIASRPSWIVINSFNEWPEGSYIEPSAAFGDMFLGISATYSQQFKAGGGAAVAFVPPPPQPTPTPTPPPTVPTAYVNTTLLNLRAGPNIESDIVGQAPSGAALPISGKDPNIPDWWQVNYSGTTAWVFGDLVTTGGPMDQVATVAGPSVANAANAEVVQASALPAGDNAQLTSQQGQGDARSENDEKSAGIAALESAGSPQLAPDYQPVLPFLAR